MTRSLQGPGRDNETDPFTSLVREVADLQRRIDDATAQVLRMAGLRAEPGALLVEGALNVTGPMTVGGTLSLPAGIIGNDALANPVTTAFGTNAQSNFAIGTSFGDLAVAPIAIPAGFTAATIVVFGKVLVNNPGPQTFLYIECGKAGDSGGGMADPLPVGYSVHEMLGILQLTGLSAGTLNTAVRVRADAAIPTNTSNTAYTRTYATLYR